MEEVIGAWWGAVRIGTALARACRTAVLALAPLALGACAAFDGYPKRATDPEADLGKLEAMIDVSAMAMCLKTPTEGCRNEIVSARMYAVDIRFSQFEETLFRDTRKAGFSATLATLGLNSAAAVSSGGAAQVHDHVGRDVLRTVGLQPGGEQPVELVLADHACCPPGAVSRSPASMDARMERVA